MDSAPVILPIQLQPSNLRPLAYRIISKKHGINIKSDALKVLADYIGPKFGIEWKSLNSQRFLEEVAKIWKEQERGLFLDSEGLEDVLKEIDALEAKSIRSKRDHQTVESIIHKVPQQRIEKQIEMEVERENDNDVEKIEVEKEEEVKEPEEVEYASQQDDLIDDAILQRTSPATSITPPPMMETLDWKEYFRLINVFEQPIFNYNFIRKQYELAASQKSKLLSSSLESNITLFQKRYHIVRDRLLRSENFNANNTFDTPSSSTNTNSITQIKNLLGRNNQRFLLLGMLTILNGDMFLQDTSDRILLNIEQTEPNPGSFYTPGNIILCDGIYSSGTFYCSSMAHPPGERRLDTLEANGNIDLLGIHANFRIDKELNQRLRLVENELEHKLIILGVNCYLDNLRNLDALDKLFKTISSEEQLPIAIIFNGSFSSVVKSSSQYKQLFDSLAAVLENYPRITGNVSLIFIPGENDQWQTPIWPKTPIPKLFGSRLNRVARNVQWGSNPTRLVYLSQEIVINNDNLCSRFRRNTTIFPMIEKEQEEINLDQGEEGKSEIDKLEGLPTRVIEARKLVKTVLDQGHLSPFTKDLKPTMWNLDHTLALSPIPNILIMSDSSSPSFDVTYNGCKCLNPGLLINKRKLNYMEVELSTRKCETKEIYF